MSLHRGKYQRAELLHCRAGHSFEKCHRALSELKNKWYGQGHYPCKLRCSPGLITVNISHWKAVLSFGNKNEWLGIFLKNVNNAQRMQLKSLKLFKLPFLPPLQFAVKGTVFLEAFLTTWNCLEHTISVSCRVPLQIKCTFVKTKRSKTFINIHIYLATL